MPTGRGREVVAIAQELVPAIEADVAGLIGVEGLDRLRADLRAIIDG
ncbi:hypothetical protein [Nocardia sp. NPDC004415]